MASPTAYLVLASQRSGSTLLVESLRATGVAGEPQEFFQYLPTTSQSPQPRQWFEGVEDESILRLLDPLDEGKPDIAPCRDLARLHPHRGTHTERRVGRQADVEPDAAAARPRRGPAEPLRAGPARRHPRRRRLRSRAGARVPARRRLAGRVVLAGRADAGLARQARPGPRCPRRVPRRRDRPRRHDAARAGGGLAELVRRGEHRADRRFVSGVVAQPDPGGRHRARGAGTRPAAGAGPRCWNVRPTSAPTTGWTATARMPKERDCRYDGSRSGCGTTSTNCGCWRPRRSTSSARSSPNWSDPCCCSRRARTRSCYFAWRRRHFGRSRCRFRCCTSTPATTSTRSSNSATVGSTSTATS